VSGEISIVTLVGDSINATNHVLRILVLMFDTSGHKNIIEDVIMLMSDILGKEQAARRQLQEL
jgi:hypothetical protein